MKSSCFPQWIVKWHHIELLANLYPVSFGVICYFLLIFLPTDIITKHPELKVFVDFMSHFIPSISAFSDNVQYESVKFVYALSWAMLPFWTPAYPWKTIFSSNNDNVTKLRILKSKLKRTLKNRFIALFFPFLAILLMWVCWSGYPFLEGPPDLLKPVSFVNNFTIALLIYIFSQGFLLGFWITVIGIYLYPTFMQFAFSRSNA